MYYCNPNLNFSITRGALPPPIYKLQPEVIQIDDDPQPEVQSTTRPQPIYNQPYKLTPVMFDGPLNVYPPQHYQMPVQTPFGYMMPQYRPPMPNLCLDSVSHSDTQLKIKTLITPPEKQEKHQPVPRRLDIDALEKQGLVYDYVPKNKHRGHVGAMYDQIPYKTTSKEKQRLVKTKDKYVRRSNGDSNESYSLDQSSNPSKRYKMAEKYQRKARFRQARLHDGESD